MIGFKLDFKTFPAGWGGWKVGSSGNKANLTQLRLEANLGNKKDLNSVNDTSFYGLEAQPTQVLIHISSLDLLLTCIHLHNESSQNLKKY